jgi:hypothetical protein
MYNPLVPMDVPPSVPKPYSRPTDIKTFAFDKCRSRFTRYPPLKDSYTSPKTEYEGGRSTTPSSYGHDPTPYGDSLDYGLKFPLFQQNLSFSVHDLRHLNTPAPPRFL